MPNTSTRKKADLRGKKSRAEKFFLKEQTRISQMGRTATANQASENCESALCYVETLRGKWFQAGPVQLGKFRS
jgi:hypothetical protein